MAGMLPRFHPSKRSFVRLAFTARAAPKAQSSRQGRRTLLLSSAALGVILPSWPAHGGGLGHSRWSAIKLAYRAQHLAAIAEHDAKFLEVLVRQVSKDGEINAVLRNRSAYSDMPSEASQSAIVDKTFNPQVASHHLLCWLRKLAAFNLSERASRGAETPPNAVRILGRSFLPMSPALPHQVDGDFGASPSHGQSAMAAIGASNCTKANKISDAPRTSLLHEAGVFGGAAMLSGM